MSTSLDPIKTLLKPLPGIQGIELVSFYRWIKLVLLHDVPDDTFDALARRLRLPQSSIYKMMQTLQKGGYVEIIEDLVNRRGGKKSVRPTARLMEYFEDLGDITISDGAAMVDQLLEATYLTNAKRWNTPVLQGKLSGGQLLVLSALLLKADVNGVVGAVTFSQMQNLSGLTRPTVKAFIKQLRSEGIIAWYSPGGMDVPYLSRQKKRKAFKRSSWMVLNLLALASNVEVQKKVVILDSIADLMGKLVYWCTHYGFLERRHGVRASVLRSLFRAMREIDNKQSGSSSIKVCLTRLCKLLPEIGIPADLVKLVEQPIGEASNADKNINKIADILFSIFIRLHKERMDILGVRDMGGSREDFMMIASDMSAIEFFVRSESSRQKTHFILMRTVEYILNSGGAFQDQGLDDDLIAKYLELALSEAHGEIQISPSSARYLRELVSRAVVDIINLFKEKKLFEGIEPNDSEGVVCRLAAMEDLSCHKLMIYTTR
jgi:DNA-binding MarR family transcriptional regulator